MSGGFAASGWGQWGIGGEPSPAANPLLSRPSLVWCIELDLSASFPVTFPFTFAVKPLRVCTGDEYPPGALGGTLYERRALEVGEVTMQAPDPFGGPQQVGGFTFRLAATSDDSAAYPDLHLWVGWEHRGKMVRAHLYDRESGEVSQNVFVGQIVAMADDLHTVSIACRAFDAASLTETVPRTALTTGDAPYAPATSLGGGDRRVMVALGGGIGRGIAAVPVRAPSEEDTRVAVEFTADAGADWLTVTHDFALGDGPFRLGSTERLPAGLESTRDYWIVPTGDDVHAYLAASAGDAFAAPAVIVDILDAGAGTHTLTGGIAPNLADEWDYAVALGNVGVVRVWAHGMPSGADHGQASTLPDQYTVFTRRQLLNGEWATIIRFRAAPVEPVTVDVLGIYAPIDACVVAEWKWLRGFEEEVAGLTATPVGMTTADLGSNHVLGFGLGAVRFDGTPGKRLEVRLDTFAVEEFTVEIELTPRKRALTGVYPLAVGPRSDTSGWKLNYDATNDKITGTVVFRDSTATITTGNGSVPNLRATRITLRRLGTEVAVFVGPAKLYAATHASPVKYDPSTTAATPLRLGGAASPNLSVPGDLGAVRMSIGGRTDREIAHAWWRMRRNAVETLRGIATQAGHQVDGASWSQGAIDCDAVGNGALRWDGYLTEETSLSSVLAAAAPFRDFTHGVNAAGQLTIAVAQPPTAIVAQFGTGDEFANLLESPTRNRASLTEAVREVIVRFRQIRDVSGALTTNGLEVRRGVFSVGTPVTLLLPFVDEPAVADRIADWRAKRMVTRDQVFGLAVGHEGRLLQLEHTIRVRVPTMSVPTLDLHVIQIAKGPTRQSIRAVPAGAGDFEYTPRRLPADPALPVLTRLDLGTTPGIVLSVSNRVLQATVRPITTTVQRPNGLGMPSQWDMLVGAPSAWQAVADDPSDEGASYVAGGNQQTQLFAFPELPRVLATVDAVTLTARLRTADPGTTVSVLPVLISGGVSRVGFTPWVVSATTFSDCTATFRTSPFGRTGAAAAWRPAELNGLQCGLYVLDVQSAPNARIRCTQFARSTAQSLDFDDLLGWIKWWIRGPSASAPATPAETDASAPTDHQPLDASIGDWHLGGGHPIPGTGTGTWWVWARVYDRLGRLVALLGPTSIVVT